MYIYKHIVICIYTYIYMAMGCPVTVSGFYHNNVGIKISILEIVILHDYIWLFILILGVTISRFCSAG
jgi:hypothetical protein